MHKDATKAFGAHDWTCHTRPLWPISRLCFDGACLFVGGRKCGVVVIGKSAGVTFADMPD